MATLQITYAELRREIGRFLGYGRDPDDWTAGSDEITDVDDILRAGMRYFYWPNVGDSRYVWSFLRKLDTLSTTSGTRSYTLPDDFGGMLNGFSYAAGENHPMIERVSEEEVRILHGSGDLSGKPTYFGLRTSQPVAGETSDYEVLFHPVPDDTYVLSYRYAIEPEGLDEFNIYHLGGAMHSECVLESCLAAAEKTLDPENGPGVHAQRFAECLQASLKIDMEMQ